MMLAMDDILKNRIHLLDGGLTVSLNPIRQLKILSVVHPKVTFSSQPKHTVRCRKRPVYKFRSLPRLTKQWQVLVFIAGISSAHRGLTQGMEKAAASYAPPVSVCPQHSNTASTILNAHLPLVLCISCSPGVR